VLSAIYLLWSYERVALGEVTVEKNKTLSDASARERIILVTMAVAILFMGVASPLFTRRMEVSVNNVLQQTSSPRNASHSPATAPGRPLIAMPGPPAQASSVVAAIVERRTQP
jgi:NADH:ubiquinone oxidoreductase subunit 4 (subunit M)